MVEAIDRRAVLRTGMLAAVALVVPAGAGSGAPAAATFEPNAWVSVAADGRVTLTMTQIEMGQGAQTGLSMIIAEELDVDLATVRIEQAMADKARYGTQATGGSTSIRRGWMPMRKAGATARHLLVAAAAARWNVDPSSCGTSAGTVVHVASGRQAAYGSLVAAAARLPVPEDVPLKDPSLFRLIGRPLPRVEGRAKVNGSAVFGIDAAIPGRRVATLAQSPVFGGTLATVDDAAAKAIPGVFRIVRLADAVAVVADTMPNACKGLDALVLTWNDGPLGTLDSARIYADLEAATTVAGSVARRVGDPDKAQGHRIEALYHQPFLAHAPIEPMSCTVHVTPAGCDVWTGTQVATDARSGVARLLGMPIEKVRVHVYLMGGGFGRRLEADGVMRAVQVARLVDGPVQLIWTREEDTRHDLYRPAYVDRISAVVDPSGKPVGWHHRIAGSSIMARLYPAGFKGVDIDAVECAAEPVYVLPHLQVEFNRVECGVPTSWWRGVGATRSLFVIESFIDELAAAARQDPVVYRRSLLADPRALAVLDLAARQAGWGKRLPRRWGRGVSLQQAFGSYTAMVAEISIEAKGAVRLRRVVCAVDCGRVINPDMVHAQIEGGAIFGAGAALMSEITIAKGRVEQSTFTDYPILTMATAPKVEAHVVESSAEPGGVGEVATAGIAPAIANAVFAATGERIRALPIARSRLAWTS